MSSFSPLCEGRGRNTVINDEKNRRGRALGNRTREAELLLLPPSAEPLSWQRRNRQAFFWVDCDLSSLYLTICIIIIIIALAVFCFKEE